MPSAGENVAPQKAPDVRGITSLTRFAPAFRRIGVNARRVGPSSRYGCSQRSSPQEIGWSAYRSKVDFAPGFSHTGGRISTSFTYAFAPARFHSPIFGVPRRGLRL